MSRAAHEALAAGGWTPWRGGPAPVGPGALVMVLLSDGSTRQGAAEEWCWVRDAAPFGFEEPDEIVAYR